AVRVPRCNQAVVCQHDDGKGPAHLAQCIDDASEQGVSTRVGDQVDNDFAVRRRLEDRAIGFQLVTQYLGINQVSVMSEREIAEGEVDDQRLDVLEIVSSGSGIAVVSYCHRAG